MQVAYPIILVSITIDKGILGSLSVLMPQAHTVIYILIFSKLSVDFLALNTGIATLY